MIAAVSLLSFAYFATIELIAFSYAISGCSFSMSEIQIEMNPFHRFPSREIRPIDVSSLPALRLVQFRRFAHHARNRLLPEEFEHLLYVELLIVAGFHHRLLLVHAILHDVT